MPLASYSLPRGGRRCGPLHSRCHRILPHLRLLAFCLLDEGLQGLLPYRDSHDVTHP